MRYIVELFLRGSWHYADSANTQRLAELLAASRAVVINFGDEKIRLRTRVRDGDTGRIVADFC